MGNNFNLDEKTKKVLKEDYDIEIKEEEEKDKKNIIHVSQIKNKRFILEQIATSATGATRQTEGKRDYKFLMYQREKGKISLVSSLKIGKYTYKPLESELIDTKSIYLPTSAIMYGSTSKLLKEIKEYLNFYFEVDSSMEKILPHYVIFTWVFEKFPFIPYLQFVGRTSTGKTTAGETIASICYKAVDATGAASQSAIFRIANDWGGTLFLDEFNLKGTSQETYSSMVSFLKSGVSDRAVLRVEAKGKNFSVKPYMVKSPKIFTSEETIADAGLQSRTIVIKMEKNKRKLPLYKLSDYYEKGQELRNKLLMWRLENLDKIDLSEIEYGFKELKMVDRRVQQILTPIYYLSDKKAKTEILEFAKEQEEKTKEERRNSEEGTVFTLIYEYYETQHAQPALKYITDQLNQQREDLGYKTKRTERKMGNIVRELLGFQIERIGHDNISTIMLEKDLPKYKELVSYYGLPSVQPVASVASDAERILNAPN